MPAAGFLDLTPTIAKDRLRSGTSSMIQKRMMRTHLRVDFSETEIRISDLLIGGFRGRRGFQGSPGLQKTRRAEHIYRNQRPWFSGSDRGTFRVEPILDDVIWPWAASFPLSRQAMPQRY